jgi:hypothetical protein
MTKMLLFILVCASLFIIFCSKFMECNVTEAEEEKHKFFIKEINADN